MSICDLARHSCKTSDLADWLKCISSGAYNLGVKLWKEGDPSGALPLVRASCEWSKAALSEGEESKEEDSVWRSMKEGLPNKYELLAGCYLRLEDRKVGRRAIDHSADSTVRPPCGHTSTLSSTKRR